MAAEVIDVLNAFLQSDPLHMKVIVPCSGLGDCIKEDYKWAKLMIF